MTPLNGMTFEVRKSVDTEDWHPIDGWRLPETVQESDDESR